MKFTIIKSCLARFSGIFAVGTPSNIHGTVISYRCAKFGAFVNSVTILTLRDLTIWNAWHHAWHIMTALFPVLRVFWFWLTEFCKADHTTWQLTLQDINTTPKEPKTEQGRSLDSCVAGVCVSLAPETPFPFHGIRSGKIPLRDRSPGRGRGAEDFRGNRFIFGRTKGEISRNWEPKTGDHWKL